MLKVLFCINLLLSYPLTLYPANTIIENYLFGTWIEYQPNSRTLYWAQNISRCLIVIGSIAFTIALGERVDCYLSLVGALTCSPVQFILPAIFHLRIDKLQEQGTLVNAAQHQMVHYLNNSDDGDIGQDIVNFCADEIIVEPNYVSSKLKGSTNANHAASVRLTTKRLTKCEKVKDVIIIAFSLVLMAFCTFEGIRNWIK